MERLVDKIRAEVEKLAPAGVFVLGAANGRRFLLPSTSDGSCIEIEQVEWYPACKWSLAEYRPGHPPVSHFVDCEWAILTWLAERWRSRYAINPRRNAA